MINSNAIGNMMSNANEMEDVSGKNVECKHKFAEGTHTHTHSSILTYYIIANPNGKNTVPTV